MIFQQGDIVEVSFDPARGHEPQKTRPALVVSSFDFNVSCGVTIVCPITSANHHFYLDEPLSDYCCVSGFVQMELVRAVDLDARGARKIGALDAEALAPILERAHHLRHPNRPPRPPRAGSFGLRAGDLIAHIRLALMGGGGIRQLLLVRLP